MVIDGINGTIRLYPDGRLSIQTLGEKEIDIPYHHEDINFSGDCVYATQKHFI